MPTLSPFWFFVIPAGLILGMFYLVFRDELKPSAPSTVDIPPPSRAQIRINMTSFFIALLFACLAVALLDSDDDLDAEQERGFITVPYDKPCPTGYTNPTYIGDGAIECQIDTREQK